MQYYIISSWIKTTNEDNKYDTIARIGYYLGFN